MNESEATEEYEVVLRCRGCGAVIATDGRAAHDAEHRRKCIYCRSGVSPTGSDSRRTDDGRVYHDVCRRYAESRLSDSHRTETG